MMADDEELLHRIGRLERRIDRERRARAAAEQIAEAGLRSLYDANVELDGRILERTNELYRALEVAEAANNAKSLFLGQMSHQINTPLNGLLGMLELLSTELHDPQIREWHASAVRSARRLERMTTRLITYVELEHAEDLGEANRFRPIQDLLAAVYDRWHMTCIRGGQLLAVEVATGMNTVVVHSEEIDLLFDELMSNVVEHAGPGAVTISAQSTERSNEMLITIRDPGPGVDPEVVHLLHDLSGSPDQTRRPDAKVNLGLALVDRIIQAHGGRWTPLDEAGAGSAIAVVLPARPSFAPD